MKFNHVTIAVLSVAFRVSTISRPFLVLGNEMLDSGYEDDSDDDGLNTSIDLIDDDDEGFSDVSTTSSSRWLGQNDPMCSKACDPDRLNDFRATFGDVEIEDEDGNEATDGTFGRLFGLMHDFFDRMKGLFRSENRQEDGPRYLVPTTAIVQMLSSNSAKFKSLVTMMRQEGEEQSTSLEFVKRLYDLSAENMESVVTVLDSVVIDLQQSDKIDIRTLGCRMKPIAMLLHNTTVPNMEFIAQAVYTQSGDVDMEDRFRVFHDTKTTTSESAISVASKINGDTCSMNDASSPTATARVFSSRDISTLPTDGWLKLAAPYIRRIVLEILFFPISIVLSLVGIVLSIILSIILSPILIPLILATWDADDFSSVLVITIVFVVPIFLTVLPIILILEIIRNLKGLLGIFGPVPVVPTYAPSPEPSISPAYITPSMRIYTPVPSRAPVTGRPTTPYVAVTADDVMYRLSVALESPLETIAAVFQKNENSNRDNMNPDDDRDDMECELATFFCQTNAVSEELPF